MNNYIHKSRINFVNLIVHYIIENYANKINKIIVYGESVDCSVKNPKSLDIALSFIKDSDSKDYEMLGDILSYMGEIVTEGDCTLTPINTIPITRKYLCAIRDGVVVYEK